jgi:hypothetical protein
MPRILLAAPLALLAAAALAAAAAGLASAQENRGPLQQIGEIDAAEYIRGVLSNDRYDPEDRERARNYAPEIEAGEHWRSSIFDGRRTRATRGTGIRLPDIDRGQE